MAPMRIRFWRSSLHTNRSSKFRAQNWWNILDLNSLTLTLTPTLSPGEREKLFPRLERTQASGLPWFRGSKSKICFGDFSPHRRPCLPPPTRRGRRCCRVLMRSCAGWFRDSKRELLGAVLPRSVRRREWSNAPRRGRADLQVSRERGRRQSQTHKNWLRRSFRPGAPAGAPHRPDRRRGEGEIVAAF